MHEQDEIVLTYAPDANVGSYDKPVEFKASGQIMQSTALQRGWTWMSMYVEPILEDINSVMAMTKNERKKYQNIKSKTAIATPTTDYNSFTGSLTSIEPGNMYKIQVSSATNITFYGKIIDVENTPQTIYPGFNWIGSLSNNVMTLEDAFADLEPKKDDMVKTRNAVAFYNGQGVWEGTLKSLVPGVGYIYLSNDDKVKTFHYPKLNFAANSFEAFAAQANFVGEKENESTYYQPVDDHMFPDNMNIIAVVQLDGENINDAEVGAFINGECRGTVRCINGYYFLTIMGSATDDMENKVEIRVRKDGKDYVMNSIEFISDAVHGTLEKPYVLDLNATGIKNVIDDDENDTEWYTLEGFKIGRKPTKQGVYIHRGQKVTVRRPSK